MQSVTYVFFVFFVWLGVLSAILFWIFRYFRRLSKEVQRGNLIQVLERIFEKERQNSKDLEEVNKYLRRLDDDGKLHIQRLGLIKFNPFEELGGDHSFSLALLDGKDTGLIITGLHTRERTRVYVKDVKRGKSSLELSVEEMKALKLAQKVK